MIDWNKPLQTVDGRAARLIGVLDTALRDTHICAVITDSGNEGAFIYPPSGTYYLDETSRHDLENVSVDWTKGVKTMEGYEARLLTTLNDGTYPYILVVKDNNGKESIATVTKKGFLISGSSTQYILNT